MARDFLGNIRGPQGERGPKGDDGARGPQGESETPYIVDSGELIDETGAHYYEIYKTGFAKAWGYYFFKNVDFSREMNNGNYRAEDYYYIDGLLEFDNESLSAFIYADGRSNLANVYAINGGGSVIAYHPTRIRLIIADTHEFLERDIYVSYSYQGKPV